MAGKKNKFYQEKIEFILTCWISGGLLLVNNTLLAASLPPRNSDYSNSKSFASKKIIIAKPPDERQPEAVEQGIEKIPTSETPIQRKPSQPIESPLPPTTSPSETPTAQPSETQPTVNPTPQPDVTPTTTPTQPTVNPTPQPDVTPTTTPTQPTVNPTPQPDVTPATTPTQTAPTPQRRQTTPRPDVTPTTTPAQTAPTPQRRQTRPQPDVTPTTTPTQTAPTPQRPRPRPQPDVTPTTTPTQTAPTPQRPRPRPQPDVTPTTPTQRQSTPINRPVESSPTNQPVNPTTTKPSGRTIPQRQRNQQRNTKSPLSSPGKYRNINFVDVEIGVLARGDFQSRGRYFHFYQFEGTENQLIEIRLTGSIDKRRSNNLSLDPVMFLLDSNNKVLLTRGSNEITSGRVRSAFAFVRLPATGRYTIAVTSRNPGDSGRYSLALRNDRASYALDQSGVLTAQTALRKKGNPYSVSKFQGRRDQLVSIRADSIFEDFSPYIVLLNSRGEVVARDNDKDGRYSALIDRVRLPQDDTYYVVVLSAIPREKGTYRLTIF